MDVTTAERKGERWAVLMVDSTAVWRVWRSVAMTASMKAGYWDAKKAAEMGVRRAGNLVATKDELTAVWWGQSWAVCWVDSMVAATEYEMVASTASHSVANWVVATDVTKAGRKGEHWVDLTVDMMAAQTAWR
jgi:hypothetical protein